MIRLAAAILALAACVTWSAVMSIGKVAADFVWRIGERIRNRPKAVARRARKAARKGASNPPDEVTEPFFNVEEPMTDQVVMQLPDGSKVVRTEPTIKMRTSTKVLSVGGAVFAATAAAVIPNWDAINAGLMAACQSEYGPAIGLGGMVVMLAINVVTARLTKSPAVPGAL